MVRYPGEEKGSAVDALLRSDSIGDDRDPGGIGLERTCATGESPSGEGTPHQRRATQFPRQVERAVEQRRLSRAALETLAIIAYHQPVTRAEIEEKFRFYGKGVLPAARIEEAIAAITKLESLKSVRSLMDLLRAGGEQQRKSA